MAGIWRAIAACAGVTADVQHVSLQHLARCSSLLSWNIQLTQQSRQLTSSHSAQADAGALAATTSGAVSALPTVLQQQAGHEGLLSTLISEDSSRQLGTQHIGLYYNFDKSRVPEAFQQFHQSFYSPRPHKLQRKAGCRGLQAEFTSTSSSSLMWRRSSQELAQVLSSSEGQRVHIQGPAGSGKSITVVQLVEWARNRDWLVLYIPSAADLTRGGFFYKRPDGTYDTIISAQHVLKSMSDNHDKQLAALRLRLQESRNLLSSPAAAAAAVGGSRSAGSSGKESLQDLVNTGLSTDDNGQLAVDCCLQLVKELAAASSDIPVLLAVDDYNTLYWRTDYGTTITRTPRGRPAYQYRRELKVKNLNLAQAFKLLERDDLGSCRVLVADSSNRRVPANVRVPNPTGSTYHQPRFTAVETAHALYYYHERGLVPSPPSEQQVAAMKSITNGSGKELRKWSLSITQTDMGLL